MAKLRMKSIARIDQERKFKTKKGKVSTRATRGWYVQVAWASKKHTKFFSDGKHGGMEKARRAAIVWRDSIEVKIGKPQVRNTVVYRKKAGPMVGISETMKEGAPVYQISWVAKNGRHGRTTVSIRRWGKATAKKMALEIRKQKHVEQ